MEAHRAEARVVAMVDAHGEALRRIARRFSANLDDAEDAVQRGLEIYLRRLGRVDPATEVGWLKVVVKHEALALRRARAEAPAGEPLDPDAEAAPDQRSLDDLLAGRERAGRVAEALRAIKPDEARALLLKADGLSYREIGERMGWSYTKVNRCLTEGRKRFLAVYAEIEAGEACERVAPALAALAGGVAEAATLLELRPHLRHCAACRAKVRRLHARGRARSVAYAPLAWLHGAAQRLAGADAATGAQVAVVAGGGGGRAAAVAAVAGLCLGGPAAACLTPGTGGGGRAPAGARRGGAAAHGRARRAPPRSRRSGARQPRRSLRSSPPAPIAPRRQEFGFELAPVSRSTRRDAARRSDAGEGGRGGASEFAAGPETAAGEGPASRRGGASEFAAGPEAAAGEEPGRGAAALRDEAAAARRPRRGAAAAPSSRPAPRRRPVKGAAAPRRPGRRPVSGARHPAPRPARAAPPASSGSRPRRAAGRATRRLHGHGPRRDPDHRRPARLPRPPRRPQRRGARPGARARPARCPTRACRCRPSRARCCTCSPGSSAPSGSSRSGPSRATARSASPARSRPGAPCSASRPARSTRASRPPTSRTPASATARRSASGRPRSRCTRCPRSRRSISRSSTRTRPAIPSTTSSSCPGSAPAG